jgi:hypothetical protein
MLKWNNCLPIIVYGGKKLDDTNYGVIFFFFFTLAKVLLKKLWYMYFSFSNCADLILSFVGERVKLKYIIYNKKKFKSIVSKNDYYRLFFLSNLWGGGGGG